MATGQAAASPLRRPPAVTISSARSVFPTRRHGSQPIGGGAQSRLHDEAVPPGDGVAAVAHWIRGVVRVYCVDCPALASHSARVIAYSTSPSSSPGIRSGQSAWNSRTKRSPAFSITRHEAGLACIAVA